MAADPPCVLDPQRPCRACSAPDPSSCPYLYLLGWSTDDEPAPPERVLTVLPPVPPPARGARPAGRPAPVSPEGGR